MKSREQHIEFDRNYCEHYDPKHGIGNTENWCNAGQDRHAVSVMPSPEDRAKGIWGQPCMAGHHLPDATAVCPKWQRRSLERAEARADGIERSLNVMRTVMPFVSEWRKAWTKKNRVAKAEIVECPACKGRLHLNQAAYNGHVWAHCETKGCASWQE